MWSLDSGVPLKSYFLEQNGEAHKVAHAAPDQELKNLVVAFEGGLVQIHNLLTGAFLFNEEGSELQMVNEVANMKFFVNNNAFWFIATCWEGVVCFFKTPNFAKAAKSSTQVTFAMRNSSHISDVVTVDMSD